MTLEPIGDNIVVKIIAEPKTEGGVYLPDGASSGSCKGEVTSVGPGRFQDGQRVAMQFRVGDIVLVKRYSDVKVRLDGSDYLVVHETSVLGILRG